VALMFKVNAERVGALAQFGVLGLQAGHLALKAIRLALQ
jgi:hypothetical protein